MGVWSNHGTQGSNGFRMAFTAVCARLDGLGFRVWGVLSADAES